MQFRQLRYFVKIVEAGSFSRAATLIHVAQPALSQQIHELEDRLGVTLLRRSARGVSPTAAGEVLFREAISILHQLDQLPTVNSNDYYIDLVHLNSAGRRIATEAFVNWLRQSSTKP